MIFTHRFRVRYAETDAMRIAHHKNYLVWLEEGRVEWLRALGFSFVELEAAGFGQAVRQVHLLYRRPARFDQSLLLRIALVSATGPRVIFGYRLYDAAEYDAAPETAEPIALATTEMVWVSPDGRPVRLPVTHPFAAATAAIERHPDWGTII